MTVPEMRPMGVGEVLDRSFQTLRRHFGVLFATAAIGFAPLLVLYLVMGTPYSYMSSTGPPTAATSLALFVLGLVTMLMTAVLWGALTDEVDADARGRVVAVGAGLGTGFRATLRMIGAGILIYLAMMGLMLPVFLVGAVLAGLGAALGSSVLSGVLVVVGFVVAGAFAMVVWSSLAFLMVPALVIEKLGPIKALRRANALAKGGRIRVFVTALMAFLVVMLPAFGLPFLLGAGSMMWNPALAGQMSTTQLYLYQAVMVGASAVTTPFLVATAVYSYYDRRIRREGLDVEMASASVATSV
jgi:hypothetical protein